MLKSWINFDSAYDNIVKRSHPYLIFPSQEFRNKLAEQLDSLCQYYRERNEGAFPERIKIINEMLDSEPFDDMTQLKIHYFQLDQATNDEKFRRIEERLLKLETHQKSPKKNHVIKENTLLVPEVKKSIVSEGEMVSETQSQSKSPSIRDIIEKCLQSSTVPLTNKDISNLTGLSSGQISLAVNSPRIKPHVDIDYIREPAKYRDTTRNFKTATYMWKENK